MYHYHSKSHSYFIKNISHNLQPSLFDSYFNLWLWICIISSSWVNTSFTECKTFNDTWWHFGIIILSNSDVSSSDITRGLWYCTTKSYEYRSGVINVKSQFSMTSERQPDEWIKQNEKWVYSCSFVTYITMWYYWYIFRTGYFSVKFHLKETLHKSPKSQLTGILNIDMLVILCAKYYRM